MREEEAREADVSTEARETEADPRISAPDAHEGGPACVESPARQGQKAPGGVMD